MFSLQILSSLEKCLEYYPVFKARLRVFVSPS